MPFSFNTKDSTTKEYLSKIGEIVVSLSSLEHMMEFWIWELISAAGTARDIQWVGRRITTPLEYMQKLDLLRSMLVERLGEEVAKKFMPAYKLLQKCAEDRNDIAHSVWFIQYGTTPEKLSTLKVNDSKAFQRGKKLDFTRAHQEIKLEDLEKISQRINQAHDELIKFVHSELLKQ